MTHQTRNFQTQLRSQAGPLDFRHHRLDRVLQRGLQDLQHYMGYHQRPKSWIPLEKLTCGWHMVVHHLTIHASRVSMYIFVYLRPGRIPGWDRTAPKERVDYDSSCFLEVLHGWNYIMTPADLVLRKSCGGVQR